MNKAIDLPLTALPPASGTQGAVGKPLPHESAHLHVSGSAPYIDDLPELAGTLHCALGLSPVAHGTLRGVDVVTWVVALALDCSEVAFNSWFRHEKCPFLGALAPSMFCSCEPYLVLLPFCTDCRWAAGCLGFDS